MTERIFITGANRGIGLALVKDYVKANTRVFAACRKPDEAAELQALAAAHPNQVMLVPLDVTDSKAIQAAAENVKQHTDALDILINNAAINPPGRFQTLETLTAEGFLFMLHVNTVAPFIVVQQFSELLSKGNNPRIVNISSDMGSISMRYYGGDHGYGTSKAALNMLTRGLARDLKSQNITVISLDPGWVQTDMGGSDADLTPAESAQGIRQVVNTLTIHDSGTYRRWNGDTLPW
jgi:NAD(P)-dependent dehydrogenase (short-subunit alcohol dehydrogenase family)